MFNVKIKNIKGHAPRVWVDDEEFALKDSSLRFVYIGKDFVFKLDSNKMFKDKNSRFKNHTEREIERWDKIEILDKQYFCPPLWIGRYYGKRWAIYPKCTLNFDRTENFYTLMKRIFDKYEIYDFCSGNWALLYGSPVVIDYGYVK